MDAKTYRASNTQTALEMVQSELGPSAMIVSVRQVPGGATWEVWKEPEVEVVALPGNEQPEPRPESAPAAAKVRSEEVQFLIDQLALRLTQAAEKKSTRSQGQQPAQAEETASPKSKAKTVAPAVFPVVSRGQKTAQPERKVEEPKAKPAPATETRPAAHVNTNRSAHSDIAAATVSRQPAPKIPLPVSQPPAETNPAPTLPPSLRVVFDQLSRQGVEKNIISKLLSTCAMSMNRSGMSDSNKVNTNVRRQLEASIRTLKAYSERLICLIGSSGSGKTSACAKLAAANKEMGKKVVWICADTIHTGAIALARAYTETLNIPLHVVYTPEELAASIKSETDADLILVDTAAVNPCNHTEVIELGAYLTVLPSRTTYLVTPATAKEADLNEAAAAFGPFNLKGVLLTKLDETSFLGAVYNFISRSHLPLAYFSSGRRIFEDLLPASSSGLIDRLMGKE